MNLAQIGLGYVGLTGAVHAALAGNHVTCYDIDENVVESINKGEPKSGEFLQYLEKNIKDLLNKNLIHATNNFQELQNKDAYLISVPTEKNDRPYMDIVRKVVNDVVENFSKYDHIPLIIIESTISPGFSRVLIKDLRDKGYIVDKNYFLAIAPRRDWFACFDDKTEILTNNGWKFFKDLLITDSVATLKDNKYLFYQQPNEIFNYNYKGKLLHFKHANFDLLVTPNHQMYVSNRNEQKDYSLIEAEKLDKNWYFGKRDCLWEGKEILNFLLPECVALDQFKNVIRPPLSLDMDLWLKYLGYFLSEGHVSKEKSSYYCIITQNNDLKRKIMLEDIKKLFSNFNVKEVIGKSTDNSPKKICIYNKQLYNYLFKFGHARFKYVPDFIKDLSSRQIKIFLNSLFLGDGNFTKLGEIYQYRTTSIRLANDVQELLLKIGLSGRITKESDYEVDGDYRNCYRIQVYGTSEYRNYNTPNIFDKNRKPIEIDYEGKVYCCNVDSGVIYVRRNGLPIWSGNSEDKNLTNLRRVVGGISGLSTHKAVNVLSSVCRNIDCTTADVAELTKSVENGLLNVQVTFLEYLSLMYYTVNMNEVIKLATEGHWRLSPLHLGSGIAGRCIPLAIDYLIDGCGEFDAYDLPDLSSNFLKSIKQHNDSYKYNIADVVRKCHNKLVNEEKKENPNILIFGAGYRQDFKDIGNSPGIWYYKFLNSLYKNVTIFDPLFTQEEFDKLELGKNDVSNWDILLITVPHTDFQNIEKYVDAINLSNKKVIDCFGVWSLYKSFLRYHNIDYIQVGQINWTEV